MRWPPIVFDVAVVVVIWAVVLSAIRRRRAQMTASSSQAQRGRRLHELAAIAATIGVTWFVAWLVTDATGPHWLHVLSVPAALAFVGAGAVVAGYAGWRGGP